MSPGNNKINVEPPQAGPLKNYGLTDQWLRRRLRGRNILVDLPRPNRANWPRWRAALTSEDPTLSGAARLLLAQPVDMEEVEHFRLLARLPVELIEVWQATGSEEILEVILNLAEAIDGWAGLALLEEMIEEGQAPPGLPDRLFCLARNGPSGPAEPPPRPGPPGELTAWGRWRPPELERFTTLLDLWASELARVRAITEQVSRHTGRVVVALFNANLAASLAWGAPDPFFSLSEDQRRALSLAAAEKLKITRPVAASAQARELKQAWLERSALPALRRELAGLAGLLNLNGRPWQTADWLDRARPVTGRRPLTWLEGPWPLAFRSPEAAQSRVEQALNRARTRLQNWDETLARLLAWALAGRELPAGPTLPGLVIPLVGKFSASTRAGLDSGHLAAWLAFLRRLLPEALFLLFDDTDRPDCALSRVVAALEEAQGLGPFGRLSEDNPEAVISQEAGPGRLFALRPLAHGSGCRNPAEILAGNCPQGLAPATHNPCWKDGLSVLLSGVNETPVSPAESGPLFPDRLTSTTGQWPVGLWCRLKMCPPGGGWLEPDRDLRLS